MQGKDHDLLFLLTAKLKFCILEYNLEKGELKETTWSVVTDTTSHLLSKGVFLPFVFRLRQGNPKSEPSS